MPFYLRKSVRLGPLRFNLSKSGIGTSVGVTGFRLGTGPRGNYVHMGRSGLYYRSTLPSSSTSSRRPALPSQSLPVDARADALTEIESGSVLGMTDSSSEGLLRELNVKHQRWRLWPWVLAGTLIGVPLLSNVAGFEFLWPILMLVGVCGTLIVSYWDGVRRTTILLYDLEADAEQRYQSLHDVFDQFAACGGTWHLQAEGATKNWKRTGGANTLVRRKGIHLRKNTPSTLRTNIEVPTLPAGRQTLCFLPDRLVVFDRDGVGAVGYNKLSVEFSSSPFIESEMVPGDATVVGQTWRYVNKKGGPDKRFKNNRQIPVCLYEEIQFSSPTGLREAFQVSKPGMGERLRSVVQAQLEAATNTVPTA